MARSANSLLNRSLHQRRVINFKGRTLKEVAGNLHKSWQGKCGSSEADILKKLQMAESQGLIVPRYRRGRQKGFRTLRFVEREALEARQQDVALTKGKLPLSPAERRELGRRREHQIKRTVLRAHTPFRDLIVDPEPVLTKKDRRRHTPEWYPADPSLV